MLDLLTEKLRRAGVKIKSEPKVKVQNIVASVDFSRGFDLEEIARNFENAEYEPEVFPGLVLRLDDPKVAVLLFATGKGVCAGAKSERDVERAAARVIKTLRPPMIGMGIRNTKGVIRNTGAKIFW